MELVEKKTSVTNELSEQPSALVQEEDFAKQLRLARYLAASSLPASRPLEPGSLGKSAEAGAIHQKAGV